MTTQQQQPILFDFAELVTEMIRKRGIHEGQWALFIEFGLTAANMGFRDANDPNSPEGPDEGPPKAVLPTAIIPIKNIGIVPTDLETNISVNAAIVNPKSRSKPARKTPKKK